MLTYLMSMFIWTCKIFNLCTLNTAFSNLSTSPSLYGYVKLLNICCIVVFVLLSFSEVQVNSPSINIQHVQS